MTGPEKEKVERARVVRKGRRAAGPSPAGGTVLAEPGATVRTDGLSRKLVTTLIAAVGTQVVALAVNWISTGKFDKVELAQVVGIALTTIFGTVAGYLAQPDNQTTARGK